MMVSVYCGVGMMYSWMWQLSWIVRHTWYDLSWSKPAFFITRHRLRLIFITHPLTDEIGQPMVPTQTHFVAAL
jgi:hypothetical protein